jgi:hypothetical protein
MTKCRCICHKQTGAIKSYCLSTKEKALAIRKLIKSRDSISEINNVIRLLNTLGEENGRM